MAAPRNLTNQEKREFAIEITNELPEQCVQDPLRLCHRLSTAVGRLEYDYNLGKINKEDALENAKDTKQIIAKHCLKGLQMDGTRTVCGYEGVANPQLG
jgi:hypothetical protein